MVNFYVSVEKSKITDKNDLFIFNKFLGENITNLKV